MENASPALVTVYAVKATSETNVFLLDADIQDTSGEVFRCEFVSRPDDVFGLGPAARQWLDETDHEVLPYVPPSAEEVRQGLPRITRRQLRLALLSSGITAAQVSAVIDAMPDGTDKEMAKIEWEDASTFERLHPLLASVGSALGLTDEQIDTMWAAAAAL